MKVVPHRLNARGLHAFRALLSIRIMHHVIRENSKPGDAAETWRQALLRDGFVATTFKAAPLDQPLLPDGIRAALEALFRRSFADRLLGPWHEFKAEERSPRDWRDIQGGKDKQLYLHVDTYMPTYKIWIFRDTRLENGPFNFVRGSHLASEAKLRWLFERTKHLTHVGAFPRPSSHRYYPPGPYTEATQGYEGALRVIGFDPDDTAASHALLRRMGFETPTAMLPSASGENLVVIADTSGFHFRGRSKPGQRRLQILPPVAKLPRLPPDDPPMKYGGQRANGGLNCAWRKNVFHCASHGAECTLP